MEPRGVRRARAGHSERLGPVPAHRGIATNTNAFRSFGYDEGLSVVWWQEQQEVVEIGLDPPAGSTVVERFGYDELKRAGRHGAELLAEPPLPVADDHISVEEHRQLELTLTVVLKQTETLQLSDEDRAQLDMLINTLHLQLRAPRPDRPIIGRALKGIATVAGGLFLGVAGNYLTDLLRRFDMPWP